HQRNTPPRTLHRHRLHYLDQFGCWLLPLRVIWRMSLPSRAIVKICDLPARVDMNARCRPLPDQVGLSLVPSPKVNCRTCRVARSITLMSLPGPFRAEKAISLYGAGDHVGRSEYSDVRRCGAPTPSASIT